MTNMETRDFEVRASKEERVLEGRAVPYGETIDLGGFKERFERGAFGEIEDVKLFYGHNEPIGKVVEGRDDEDGYYVRAVISKTERGNEVYELIKDGVLNRFSVGFMPVEQRDDEDVIVRTKATLKEVSVVAFPAYTGAHITSVRSDGSETAEMANTNNTKEDIIMSNDSNAPEVAELREAVSDLERKVNVLSVEDKDTGAVAFRSGGDFLKALAKGDDAAQNEIRAYTGAVMADAPARNGWVDRTLKLVEENRNIVNLFQRAGLPASGNTIEYPQVKTTVGTVAEQAAEGDNLAYLEVQTETKTAPIKVYGGYSELSRQVIERSDVAYLETVLRFQASQYAKVTNAAARAALVAGAATYNVPTGLTLATAKGKDWVKVVIDSVAAIEDNGLGAQADFILCSRDVFSTLMTLAGTDERPVFNVNADSVNSFGNANIKGLTGSLAGLPLVVDPGLAAKQFYVASSEALTTYENAGAPVRLDDENIINLTKQFSLYGYLAVAVHNAKGIAKPAIA